MNDEKNIDPIILSLRSDQNLKEYHCPHCNRFLFKGNVKKLSMACHHCQKFISAVESEI